ncbi:hypothetical protein PR048_003197 [Dryococelus australis]|uniref:Uncharacterized protein n=1 Tax=Dryococelus australis TaxID=614101 RepID=A0ABQ9IMG4_9NEOP|nr:hypothetical protein PR048_003197 [Dryococelus australis]
MRDLNISTEPPDFLASKLKEDNALQLGSEVNSLVYFKNYDREVHDNLPRLGKDTIPRPSVSHLCRSENGKILAWAAKWLHKISYFLCLLVKRKKNVINIPLVANDRIMLAIIAYQNQAVYEVSGEKYCALNTYQKLKAGVFDGPQIRKLVNYSHVIESINTIKKFALSSFVLFDTNVFDNNKVDNF